jgi:hypothetical protein
VHRRTWLGTAAVASLLLTGCAASAASAPATPDPAASHAMPDGTEMSGSEHDAHASVGGPSEAAQMVCAGQVVTAITKILGLADEPAPVPAWDEPNYSCTYEVDGAPLELSVHDATVVSDGESHFAELRAGLENAEDIEGLLGLGLPSFSTGDGIVAFLRDGKTLVVDATALPSGLGPDGTGTQDDVAYAIASAVLTCWVDHS